MKTKSLLLGLIVGGITAGISTLLTAPNSGKETRSYLKNHKDVWSINLLEIRDHILDLKNAMSTASIEGKETISTFVNDLKVLLEDWQEDIKPHKENIVNELNSIQLAIHELETQLQTEEAEEEKR